MVILAISSGLHRVGDNQRKTLTVWSKLEGCLENSDRRPKNPTPVNLENSDPKSQTVRSGKLRPRKLTPTPPPSPPPPKKKKIGQTQTQKLWPPNQENSDLENSDQKTQTPPPPQIWRTQTPIWLGNSDTPPPQPKKGKKFCKPQTLIQVTHFVKCRQIHENHIRVQLERKMQHLFTLSKKQYIRCSKGSLRVYVLQSFFFWGKGCLSFPVFFFKFWGGGGGGSEFLGQRSEFSRQPWSRTVSLPALQHFLIIDSNRVSIENRFHLRLAKA